MIYSGQVIMGPDEGMDLEADGPQMQFAIIGKDGKSHLRHYDWKRVPLPKPDCYIEGWVITMEGIE